MKLSIKAQGHSLTLVKGHSDFKVKFLTFGLYTQVSYSGPHGPLVILLIPPPPVVGASISSAVGISKMFFVPPSPLGVGGGVGISKMLKFYVKVF